MLVLCRSEVCRPSVLLLNGGYFRLASSHVRAMIERVVAVQQRTWWISPRVCHGFMLATRKFRRFDFVGLLEAIFSVSIGVADTTGVASHLQRIDS